MHIIANSSPIRCLIIAAEYLQSGPSAQGSVDDQWNEMRFRFVILTHFGGGVGTGGVEVPKSNRS